MSCPECATTLATVATATDGRTIITTFFCDLVAFTAMNEAADAEGVDAQLEAGPR